MLNNKIENKIQLKKSVELTRVNMLYSGHEMRINN
jgi:hypothetical protein